MSEEIRDAANGIIVTIVDRERTDSHIPPMMIAIILLSYLAITLYYLYKMMEQPDDTTILQLFTLISLLLIGTGIIVALFYIVMYRNARHSERESLLRRYMIEYAENNNIICGSDITNYIEELKEIDTNIRENEDTTFHKGKLAFIILPTIIATIILTFAILNDISNPRPMAFRIVIGCYIASAVIAVMASSNITVFPKKHEKNAIKFFDKFNEFAPCLNIDTEKFEKTIGYRSFWLFLFLSIITFSLFIVIWAYLIFSDMNKHFNEQWYYEDSLFKSVRTTESDIMMNNSERGKIYKLEDHWA